MPSTGPQSNSSLRDNRSHRGTVGDFLKSGIQPGSNLSFVSAYFTVHAYEALAPQLEDASKLRFLFGEPSFVTGIDRGDKGKANFKLTEHGITIAKTLTQRPAAKACVEWIERMVEIRSIRQSNFLHGKAYHIENGNASSAILGSSNFTVPGLGLGMNSNVELNLVVDSNRDRDDLKAWFEEVWNDDALTKDVRDEVLTYLKRLAAPNSPQFIYFLTLFHLFRDELEGTKDVDEALKLGIPSIKDTTRKAQAKFTNWTKKPADERKARDLIHELGSDFFKLLDGLSIARSRSQIKRYYSHEMERLGGFPKREKPTAEYPHIDLLNDFISFEELDQKISELTLSLYHPSTKLKKNLPPEVLAKYEAKIGNFNQQGRERILICMMKINFLKRLESSIDSFRLTLKRTIEKIDKLEAKIQAFENKRDSNPTLDFAKLSEDDFDDLDLDPEDLEIGGKHKINLAHLDLPEWLLAVRQDRAQLQNLLDHSRPVVPARDAKLARVREIIAAKVASPAENKDGKPVRKILLFTAFADTARYLYENLAKWSQDSLGIHTALVCGGGQYRASLGKADLEHILTNFSPLSKKRDRQPDLPQDEEIDLLIATDCISEGQNLQDCDLLINYDIHWNPVRIIQRFGRIDRIGSRNKSVSLVNFWPTKDLDAYLNVKNRVEDRMALVDLTASGEDNLLASEQIEDLIKADLHYRNKQLKDLQNGVVDFDEEDPEGISLADFSLTDFRLDLLRFLENNRELLETAELGLFAVVPPDPALRVSQPGIIFCLRQRDNKRPTEVNPLAPYYLVYVLDDGNVRLTFMQPKQALDLFRALAAGHASAFIDLCDSFDARNANGSDMSHETKLLDSAMESIKRTFARRATTSLLSGRDGLLPMASETPTSSDDMELVTWLVVVGERLKDKL